MKTLERFVMAGSFILAFLGIIHLAPTLISSALVLAILIYLFSGWYILLPAKVDKSKRWIPFIVSYLIAQTILSVLFGINNWPMRIVFSYITSAMLIIIIGIFIFYKESLKTDYPIGQYLLRLVICLMFAGAPLWM